MGYRQDTGQNKTIANATSDTLTRAHTLVTSVCAAAAAAAGVDTLIGNGGVGMMKVSRGIRKECNGAILIAFAAAMLAVCISPALASATYIPPDPTNLANTADRYWVNYTWTAGESGNVTDSYNISMNETWTNGTTATSMNVTVGPCGWANIAVWAWNASGTGTLSAGCVSDNVQAPRAERPPASIFGLVGSSGGGGTYPPGWFETPTPTVTATKAQAASTNATATPPGDKVTPAPTKRPAAAKATAPASERTTAETAKKDAPGFTAVFAICIGCLAVAYAMMRRR